jgi:4-amino-4-deoxy-L-arabinose transferase-like glycosyltransferase
LVLALLLLPFWAYKLRDLDLPYFWDELGVFGRAAVYLHDHTLGLLPSHLPPELSRGHPMLVTFTFGALFRVFGATPLVAHVFMLLLATGLVVSVFWIARWHWNAQVGLAAAALLMVQPLFLAQSTLLLLEMPLALACLWSMHAFSRKRYLLAGLCTALAIFVKETALVLGLVLGVMLLVEWLRSRPSLKSALAGILALLIPGLLYGLFLLVQKRQNGWYFFPLHAVYVNFHWAAMKGKLVDYSNFVFVEQGRFALSVVVSLWLLLRSQPGLDLRAFRDRHPGVLRRLLFHETLHAVPASAAVYSGQPGAFRIGPRPGQGTGTSGSGSLAPVPERVEIAELQLRLRHELSRVGPLTT